MRPLFCGKTGIVKLVYWLWLYRAIHTIRPCNWRALSVPYPHASQIVNLVSRIVITIPMIRPYVWGPLSDAYPLALRMVNWVWRIMIISYHLYHRYDSTIRLRALYEGCPHVSWMVNIVSRIVITCYHPYHSTIWLRTLYDASPHVSRMINIVSRVVLSVYHPWFQCHDWGNRGSLSRCCPTLMSTFLYLWGALLHHWSSVFISELPLAILSSMPRPLTDKTRTGLQFVEDIYWISLHADTASNVLFPGHFNLILWEAIPLVGDGSDWLNFSVVGEHAGQGRLRETIGTRSTMMVVVFLASAISKRSPWKLRHWAIISVTWSAVAKCSMNAFDDCCMMFTIVCFIFSTPICPSGSSRIPSREGGVVRAKAGIVHTIAL